MLSSAIPNHHIGYSSVCLAGGNVTLNLKKVTMKVSELSQEDLLNHFSPWTNNTKTANPFIQDFQVHFANDYASNAILKISPSIWKIDEEYSNYVYFKFDARTPFWIKCKIVQNPSFDSCELSLSRLALTNFKFPSHSSRHYLCEFDEFPFYITKSSPESFIFSSIQSITLRPITPFPKEEEIFTTDKIQTAIKDVLMNLRCAPLQKHHQLIIPIKCAATEYYFAAAFEIALTEPSLQDSKQFLLDDSSLIYLQMLPSSCRSIPAGLQGSLVNSFIFSRSHHFVSFPNPKSESLKEFFVNQKNGVFSALVYGPLNCGKKTFILHLADLLGAPMLHIDLYGRLRHLFKSKTTKGSNPLIQKIIFDSFKDADFIFLQGAELLESDLKLQSIWASLCREYPNRSLKIIFSYSVLSSKQKLSDYFFQSFNVVEHFKPPSRTDIAALTRELSELFVYDFNPEDFIGFSVFEFADFADKIFFSSEGKKECDASIGELLEGFKSTMKLRRSLQMKTLEIPKVTWDQVAGLEHAKKIFQELISKFSTRPRPSGILLHGPPGTGKTLLAKALATQSKFSLLPVKGPELLSPYIGESESALREVFEQARSMSPCIIFFDELDALVPRRGDFGDSVGVADRMVATFMTEMDSISGLNQLDDSETSVDQFVFVVGATNRPDLIDPALLRKGRLDISILLDAPKTVDEQAAILAASCSKFRCAKEVDFAAPFISLQNLSLSPAQISSIAGSAMRLALEKKLASAALVLENDIQGDENIKLLIDPLSTADLIAAAELLKL